MEESEWNKLDQQTKEDPNSFNKQTEEAKKKEEEIAEKVKKALASGKIKPGEEGKIYEEEGLVNPVSQTEKPPSGGGGSVADVSSGSGGTPSPAGSNVGSGNEAGPTGGANTNTNMNP